MSTVAEIKTAFKRLPERDRSKLAEWIQESVEEQDPELEAALRHSLRSPLKKTQARPLRRAGFAQPPTRNRRVKAVEIFVRHDAELDALGYFQRIVNGRARIKNLRHSDSCA